jgi:hypothetical protein
MISGSHGKSAQMLFVCWDDGTGQNSAVLLKRLSLFPPSRWSDYVTGLVDTGGCPASYPMGTGGSFPADKAAGA